MFIFLLKITVAGCSKDHLKFQYVYISTNQFIFAFLVDNFLKFQYVYISTHVAERIIATEDLKIPICLYFYLAEMEKLGFTNRLKFQYVYISTQSVDQENYNRGNLKFQYVYISTYMADLCLWKMLLLKIPICLYFYEKLDELQGGLYYLKFQYVYISTT